MKQYQIAFYYKRITAQPTVYYREFETVKELKEWANDKLNNSSWPVYSHFKYIKIPMYQFMEHS